MLSALRYWPEWPSAHTPKHMQDELTENYRDTIYADPAAEIGTCRMIFLRKWRLKCRAVADSLEEAGDRLFVFTWLERSQWKSVRIINARLGRFVPQIACRAGIERLNRAFRGWQEAAEQYGSRRVRIMNVDQKGMKDELGPDQGQFEVPLVS